MGLGMDTSFACRSPFVQDRLTYLGLLGTRYGVTRAPG